MSDTTTIYMPLLNEGTATWRPVTAERLGPDTFRVLGPKPADEEWEFGPGSVVRGAPRTFDDGKEYVVAVGRSAN